MKPKLFTLVIFAICFSACSNNDVTGPSNTAPTIEDQVFEIANEAIQDILDGRIITLVPYP